MSPRLLQRTLVIPLALATFAACNDAVTTAPKLRSAPLLAQGDNGVWTVNTILDGYDGVCDDTHCTVTEAVHFASPGGKVVFASGLQGTIALTTGTLTITKSLSIDGGGLITLDAGGNFEVMAVLNSPGAPVLTATLDGLTLKNGRSAAEGGGILIGSLNAVTIRNSTITGNATTFDGDGGGIKNFGTLTLVNSTVDGNTADGKGGGIWNDGILTVQGSAITNNVAENAGGIYHGGINMAVMRSTISGNTSVGIGVGAVISTGDFQLISSTVTRNSGFVGGITHASTTTVFNAVNAIVAGNDPKDCGNANVNSLGHNVTATGFGGCAFFSASDVRVDPTQVFTSVLEQGLKDNGGPTKTHALIARGFAVDAGYCPGETTDQRGFTRPVDDPTMPNAVDACDIGAYESQGPQIAAADLMVSQTVDKNSVKQGELLTYTVRVQNLGPQTAPNVVMNNVLSSGVTFVSSRQNKGTVTAPPKGETGTVTWNIGDMVNQANEIVEIQVTVLVKGRTTITNTATVSGTVADPNTTNNSAAITVSVAPGSSGKKP